MIYLVQGFGMLVNQNETVFLHPGDIYCKRPNDFIIQLLSCMEANGNTFKKAERLHSVTLISSLFEHGKSMFVYPFKVVYWETSEVVFPPVQLLVVVPKRTFKHAVDRNRIKRLIREAYRTNKQLLWEKRSKDAQQLLIGFVYVGKTILPYAEIEKKLILVLHRLS